MNYREKTKRSDKPSIEPMRVAILGVGGLGRTLASELRGDPRVTSLLLIDLFGERARVLTGIRGRVAAHLPHFPRGGEDVAKVPRQADRPGRLQVRPGAAPRAGDPVSRQA